MTLVLCIIAGFVTLVVSVAGLVLIVAGMFGWTDSDTIW